MPLFLFRATRHIEHLEDRLDRLERDFKRLELDFDVVYEKVRKAMQRTGRDRAIIEAKEAGTDGAGAPTSGDSAPAPTSTGRLLTARQMLVQQEILRRRAGG